MLRALSTRRSCHGYERLGDDPSVGLLEGKLKRVASVPARVLGPSSKFTPEFTFPVPDKPQPQVKVKPNKKVNKSHPLFSLFDIRRKKKTTAKPEFARYLEYVKEGGIWDVNSNMPVIHYK